MSAATSLHGLFRSKSDSDIQVARRGYSHIINIPTANAAVEQEHNVAQIQQQQQHNRQQNAVTLSRNMHVMKQLVPLLLITAGIKFQDKLSTDLFSKYYVQLWCFIGAVCIYWITIEVMQKMSTSDDDELDKYPICKFIFNCITLDCEIVSVFSLVSLLFPHPLPLHVCVATTTSTLILTVIPVSCVRFKKQILATKFTLTFKGMFTGKRTVSGSGV